MVVRGRAIDPRHVASHRPQLAARGESPAVCDSALHPVCRRCVSVAYCRYAPSSRLASCSRAKARSPGQKTGPVGGVAQAFPPSPTTFAKRTVVMRLRRARRSSRGTGVRAKEGRPAGARRSLAPAEAASSAGWPRTATAVRHNTIVA